MARSGRMEGVSSTRPTTTPDRYWRRRKLVSMSDVLPNQRHLFDLPRDVAYFNCAYMSPLMHSALEAGRLGLGRKAQPWAIVPAHFFEGPERVRSLFAQLIGATADGIALVPAASYGIETAAANLDVGRGQEIVLLDSQFPSNVYPWHRVARRTGASIVFVGTDGRPLTESVLEALSEKTAVASLPHCHWANGRMLDVAAIGRRCREVGAALVLDLTQSLGVVPFDTGTVDPDFVVAATYKWLLGPYSVALLYVAPRNRGGEPIELNWMNRESSEDFSGLTNYRDGFRSGARRFDVGESANFALLPVVSAALEQILAWGVERIGRTIARQTETIADRLGEIGLSLVPMADRAPHFLALVTPQGATSLADDLARQSVYVSVRGDLLRITPHVYNDEEDASRMVDAFRGLM